jgi:type IV secretory pathway VirB10-like protein
MSDPVQSAGLPKPKENPEALVLRGRPRPVVRFRRGLIVGLTGTVAASLITLSWFALEPPSSRKAAVADAADEPALRAAPDALANVPGSYGDVPRLGPPLPGDLGRGILDRQRSPDSIPPPIDSPSQSAAAQAGDGAVRAERERVAAARQAARASALLVQLDSGPNAGASASLEPAPAMAAPEAPATSAAVAASQQRKIDFARSSGSDRNAHELRAAPSAWTLSAGSVIAASLITGLDSDLPGTVLAQVSENVRDSATGRTVLIPQGARLIGRYDNVVAHGQRRALVVWTRIVFPDGASLQLDNMPATDASGYAGLQDRADSHTWQLLKGIGLSTLLGVSTQLSIGGGGGLVRAIRESTEQNAAHAGDQITSRNLDVQPTIKVRPGWPARVLVDTDLVLRPWRA